MRSTPHELAIDYLLDTTNGVKLGYITSTEGIVCKYCSSLLVIKGSCFVPTSKLNSPNNERGYENHAVCSCGNVGIIKDFNDHLRIYVEDIRTVARATLIHAGDFKEINRVIGEGFNMAGYTNLYGVTSKPLTFAASREYDETEDVNTPKQPRFDRELIYFLDKYRYVTSDGYERFIPSHSSKPKKKKRMNRRKH